MRIPAFKNRFGIITICLALFFALSFFLPNMIINNGRFCLNTDYMTQIVPYTVECQRAIKNGELFWNWNTELGSDFIGSYSCMVGNPFFWFTFLFKHEFIPYGMGFLYILKYILAAYASFCYLRRLVKERFWAVIAALMYTFSGFSLFNIVFYSFHEALILFPLLLLSVERIMTEGKKGIFCIAVFLSAVINFYFFIGQVVFLFVYCCIRICFRQWTNLKRLGIIVFEGFAGIALSSFLLLPTYFFLADFTRANNKLSGLDILFYYPTRYLDILRGFVFPPEIAGTNKFIISGDAAWGSVSIWIPLVGVVGVAAFMLKNKRHWLTSAIAVSIVMSFIPFLNQAYQLFSDTYYTRWWYMPLLLMALATVKFFEYSCEDWFVKLGRKAVLVSIVLYMTVAAGIFSWIGLCLIRNYTVHIDTVGYSVYFIFTFACYALTYFLIIKRSRSVKKNILILLFVTVCVSGNYYVLTLQDTYSKFNPDTYVDMCFDKNPSLSFIDNLSERVEVTDDLALNQTLYYNLMPLNFYHSIIPQSTVDFYESIGLRRREDTLIPDGKYPAIRALLSVRWYLCAGTGPDREQPVDGFRYYGNWKDYDVWKNEYWIPFGFAYDKFISFSEYMKIPVELRDRVLLKAMVVEDGMEKEISAFLDHSLLKGMETNSGDLSNDCEKLKENAAYKFERNKNGFAAGINLEEDNLVFFSVPYVKGWRAYVNGKRTEIIRANVGFMAVRAGKGNNNIRFEYTPRGIVSGVLLSFAALIAIAVYWRFIYRSRHGMNINRKILVEFLSAAIHRRNVKKIHRIGIDWKCVFEEASAHHVQPLLYLAVKELDTGLGPDEEIEKMWRKDTFLQAVIQEKHIRQIARVLDAFKRADIPVIALKGLVLREFYPRPELRTMTDADILVHEEDIVQAEKLLLQEGYFKGDSTPMHIRFEHSSRFAIEMHWLLSDERYIKDVSYLTDNIWENAVPTRICGVSCMMLSPEDQAAYLCLHMATHIAGSGFGLRQLCDLVLFIEAEGGTINWAVLKEKLGLFDIEQFAFVVFALCGRLFGMDIPHSMCCKDSENDRYLELLTEDILSGGVYGKRNLARMYGNELANHHGDSDTGCPSGKRKNFLSIFFPPVEKLSSRYAYAKKHTVLIPAAWIHHLVCGTFNRNYNFSDKLNFIFSTVPVSRKRAKLLRWLELR